MSIVKYKEIEIRIVVTRDWDEEKMGYMHECQVASVMSDSATLWTIAHHAPLSMGFSRQEYWSGLQCSSLGDLTNSGIELMSLLSSAFAGRFFTPSTTLEAQGVTQFSGYRVSV